MFRDLWFYICFLCYIFALHFFMFKFAFQITNHFSLCYWQTNPAWYISCLMASVCYRNSLNYLFYFDFSCSFCLPCWYLIIKFVVCGAMNFTPIYHRSRLQRIIFKWIAKPLLFSKWKHNGFLFSMVMKSKVTDGSNRK